MKTNQLFTFQTKESLVGKDEKLISINCDPCRENITSSYKNEACITCFLKTLFRVRNKTFHSILIKNNNMEIGSDQIILFLQYFKKIKQINRKLHSISKRKRNKCIYHEFKCKYFTK